MSARVIQGDATSPSDWDRALGGEKANALITDPPYCVLTRRRKGGGPTRYAVSAFQMSY